MELTSFPTHSPCSARAYRSGASEDGGGPARRDARTHLERCALRCGAPRLPALSPDWIGAAIVSVMAPRAVGSG